MPIEQATELEVPVTIQGSKCVEGKEQRELFTETTKTTIVFEHGAVLSLKAKVLPGQCVFLRNEQSGKEMLCKVMESRSGGEVFYTDLEFTARDPEFWDAKAAPEPSAAAPVPAPVSAPEIQKSAEEFAAPQVSAHVIDSDKPFTGEIPVTATTAAASPLAAAPPVPLPPLELVPAHEQAATIPVTPPVTPPVTASETAPGIPPESAPEIPQETPPDWDEAREQELVAALIAMEGGKASKRDLAKKETKGTAKASTSDGTEQQDDASSDAASLDDKSPDAGSEVTGFAARWWLTWRPSSLKAAAKNPVAIGIAASLVLVAVLGIAWHAKGGSSARSKRASASAAPAAPATVTPAAQAAPQASPSAATGEPSQTQVSGAAPGSPTQLVAADSRGAKTVENSSASVPASDKTAQAPLVSEQGTPRQAKPRRHGALQSAEIVPAKVVAQPPPSMPNWAKGLDTDGIVKLDALIDENGNLAGTKAISGPRMLQGAAERAVALWVFEPALADGKPIATHMTLTVEFQR